MKLKLTIILIYIAYSVVLNGQALHFSQAFYSPLNLNPAFTGVIDSNWRLISNYRSQGAYYSQPLNTISLSFDKFIKQENSKIGVGVLYNHDSSFGLTFPSDQFYFSASGITRLSENSYASLGLQLGAVWRRVSYNHLSFPEQYDRSIGGFNSNLPLSENFQKDSELYPDVNVGVMWWMQRNQNKFMSGLSVNHVNNPKDHFLEDNHRIGLRTNFHTTYEHNFSEMWKVQSQVYYTYQHKASEYLLGALVGMRIRGTESQNFKGLSFGIYGRNIFESSLESVIFSVGSNFKNWTAFISSDFDISGLKTQNMYSNSIELSLIYHRPFAILNKLTLPCIRY